MASADDNRHLRCRPAASFTGFLHSAAANLSSLLFPEGSYSPLPSSKVHLGPLILSDSVLSLTSRSDSAPPDSPPSERSRTPLSSSSSSIKSMPSPEPGSGFPSTIRISTGKGGGPAFVGQVFSMCDLSGTGLMAVSTHFDIPFLSKRTPKWLKNIFAAVTRSERNGPVFRFFMDLGDAVSYVKKLNIPTGVVGACRLDIAYEHFKEKPDMFQFVPNERQVKEANKLLKILPQSDGKKKVEGVPVFSSQNMDIAIATKDGIKWYTPYFFDKKMLDNILEDSVDQHFNALIETRNLQRRRDGVDDNLTAEAVEEMNESMWDPPEVQEVLDEMGHPGIPLSVISKAAEIQLLYAVDKVLLGNRWLRKATGIQPKFPYVIDSFQRKSAAAFLRARNPPPLISNSQFVHDAQLTKPDSLVEMKDGAHPKQERWLNFQFPFGDWCSHPWLKQPENQQHPLDSRFTYLSQRFSCMISSIAFCNKFICFPCRDAKPTRKHREQELQMSQFLPKITMVGISTGESGKMQKANIKKMMDDLMKELEKAEHVSQAGNDSTSDDRDPLFVANVGDYNAGVRKTGSTRWVRGGPL